MQNRLVLRALAADYRYLAKIGYTYSIGLNLILAIIGRRGREIGNGTVHVMILH